MSTKIRMMDGELCGQHVIDGDSPSRAYGVSVFDRFRVEQGTRGEWRFIALPEHLARTERTANYLNAPADEDRVRNWERWIRILVERYVAVHPAASNLYGDLSYGQFRTGGDVMKGQRLASWTTLFWMDQVGGLFGDGVHLVSDLEAPKYPHPLVTHKTGGPYLPYWLSKARVRQIATSLIVGSFNPDHVESVLYPMEASLRSSDWGMPVCEGGSCALLSFDRRGVCHVSGAVRFPSITEQICVRLVREIMCCEVREDLQRHHLLHGSVAVGTAARITPVLTLDGRPVKKAPQVDLLQQLFHRLCTGQLGDWSGDYTTVIA